MPPPPPLLPKPERFDVTSLFLNQGRWPSGGQKETPIMKDKRSSKAQGSERGNVDLKTDAGGGSAGQARLGGGMRKNGKPGASSADDGGGGPGEAVLRAYGVSDPGAVPGNLLVSGKSFVPAAGAADPAAAGVLGEASALRVSADRGAVATGGLLGGQAAGPAATPHGGLQAPSTRRKPPRQGVARVCRRRRHIGATCGSWTSSRTRRCAGEPFGC